VAIASKRARATARRHTGSRSGGPWPGRGVGWLASRSCRPAAPHPRQAGGCRGLVSAGGARSPAVLPGLCPLDRCSRTRGDDSASVEQCRVAIAGKRARATARQRTGCRSGGPWPGQDLGVLDHRQFGRFFVLSIGEAGHGATTAPGSSSAGWRSPASGARSKARQHTGCRSGGPWLGRGVGLQACARLPPAWLVLAVLEHRQFFRAFVLSIGEASHEATTAPASGGTGWQIASKRASSKARQRTGCRSGVPWPGRGVGLPAGVGCRRAPG
jgi:hypothetical protein